jgi:hypothetical protein
MVSDAFFPFRDGIDIGSKQGIKAVVQPRIIKILLCSLSRSNKNFSITLENIPRYQELFGKKNRRWLRGIIGDKKPSFEDA